VIEVCASRPGGSAEITLAHRAGELQARRGEEGQGAWNGAGSVEFGRGGFRRARKQRWGGVKMDAEALKAVVLKELKSGRSSDELANALSFFTSFS
jgi:hypothetical protein